MKGRLRHVLRILVSIVLIVVLLSAAIAASGVMSSRRPQVQSAQIEETVYNVDVFEVAAVSFTELLTGFGTARAEREVIVAAQVSGEVFEIHPALKVGHKVSSGKMIVDADQPSTMLDADVLLRIDPRDYQVRVAQSRAAIANIRTELEQLAQQERNVNRQLTLARQDADAIRDEYERMRMLRERGAGTASDLTRSMLELRRYEDTIVQLENQIALFPSQTDAANQRLLSAESDLQRAQYDLQRTTVAPPFNGVLAEVMVEQGQYVRNGDALVRLVDPERIEIAVSIGLADYQLIQKRIEHSDFPRALLAENETAPHRWTGNVVRVSPTANASSRTIEIFIEVINAEQTSPLLPGTFVFARIAGPSLNDTLIVPREAIVEGVAFVVDEDGRARGRRVTSERHLQSMTVINDGLSISDRLVLTNLDVVREGTPVVPQRVTTAVEEVARLRVPTIQLHDADEL